MDIQKLFNDAMADKTVLIPEMTADEKKKTSIALFKVVRALSTLSPSDKPTNYKPHITAKKKPWWKRILKK